MKNDKPEAAALGWHKLGTTYPFASPWLRLRQDHIRVDGRGETTYTYRESRGAVGVVPVTPGGEMVLIRQYRYTVDDWCIEIPSGGMHDKEGVAPEEVARDELREEIGARCRELQYVNSFYVSVAASDEVGYVYLALGVELSEETAHEETELIEVLTLPVPEALRLARTGGIKNGFSALSILLCEDLLREQGYI